MKYTYQISTGQFEYIQGECEGSPEEAVMAFNALKLAFKGGEGLPAKEFNRFLDTYLKTGKPSVDGMALWEVMDARQKDIVNECKKALKRTTN